MDVIIHLNHKLLFFITFDILISPMRILQAEIHQRSSYSAVLATSACHCNALYIVKCTVYCTVHCSVCNVIFVFAELKAQYRPLRNAIAMRFIVFSGQHVVCTVQCIVKCTADDCNTWHFLAFQCGF